MSPSSRIIGALAAASALALSAPCIAGAAAPGSLTFEQTFPLASIQMTKQALAGNQAQVQNIQYFLQIVGLLALLIGGVGLASYTDHADD